MIIRALPEFSDRIFLTFDDGPDPLSTPAVLDVLKRQRVKATFFLVGDRIAAAPEIMRRLRSEGHAVGSHSPDHRYRNFFGSSRTMESWLARGNALLSDAGIADSVGFRPPAGVLTPPLREAAARMAMPIVLWNERFYDSVFPWTKARALKSAARLPGGSIILLHDRQPAGRLTSFCNALEIYIEALRARGFQFRALAREMFK
jgi:peptidoglycan/xylan/chitin deacetylase (PgdA/CDA1 family)